MQGEDGSPIKATHTIPVSLKIDHAKAVFNDKRTNEIDTVVGNTITMKDDWVTDITTTPTNIRLKFAQYDDSSSDQRAMYAYEVANTNVFTFDNSKGYQIVF